MPRPSALPVTEIQLPELALVALIGASSAGKSSFARQHFLSTEVLSSDFFRGLVSDDENSLDANAEAFDSLFYVAGKRLERGHLTVIDATSVRAHDRKRLIDLARAHDVLPVAIVLDLAREVLLERHAQRPDRDFHPEVIRRQQSELRRTLGGLSKEGFRHVWVLRQPEEVSAVQVSRVPLYCNRKSLRGPFDFIGDVHGCLPELLDLLNRLGYQVQGEEVFPPAGRMAVFVGDLVDRGPDSAGVLRLVMRMVQQGSALCVPGNHDEKLKRALEGKAVNPQHGLAEPLQQLDAAGDEFKQQVRAFLDGLISHLLLDDGRVVVAHAGLPAKYQGRTSGRVRSFALYGDVDGSKDELGLPVRRDWAAEYRGKALVVYGHTPVAVPRQLNNTVNIDTGCAFGGQLSALRYPELELLSVPARAQYAVPARPLTITPETTTLAAFDLAEFTQAGRIQTQHLGGILLKAGERQAAVETFSRYGVDPQWCLYLPPTMSPVETSTAETSAEGEYLEHPAQAFNYYRHQGLPQVICEEKHMGSRALIVVTRDQAAAQQHFGISQGTGSIYTRTGRPFFKPDWEEDVLGRIQRAVEAAGLWKRLQTSWLLLDAEIMPWSLKAGELIKGQYAAVGAAGLSALSASVQVLQQAQDRGLDVQALLSRTQQRLEDLGAYREAYRAYVRRVNGPQDVKILPFHLLASERAVHSDQDHLWHLNTLAALAQADPQLFGQTAHQVVDLADEQSVQQATQWWQDLTEAGQEGMVVKPMTFFDPREPSRQPALKVRGREYLRIIYGPEYTRPEHLSRLRARAVNAKRARALREFHLGLEGLHRFIQHGGTAQVHECVLGVLALEADPLDARL